MAEADKIVAAIFAANMLSGKSADPAKYLDTYEQFLDLMDRRDGSKHQMPPITPENLAEIAAAPKVR
jgi:hypothetical protein